MSAKLETLNNREINLNLLDDLLQPLPKEEEADPNEDRFIINSRQIDTHTIKRTRVKITPAVCDICGFDVAKLAYEQNKLATPNYDELTLEIQSVLQQATLKHKQLAHTVADNLIVSASQLKKAKKWLSGRDV